MPLSNYGDEEKVKIRLFKEREDENVNSPRKKINKFDILEESRRNRYLTNMYRQKMSSADGPI